MARLDLQSCVLRRGLSIPRRARSLTINVPRARCRRHQLHHGPASRLVHHLKWGSLEFQGQMLGQIWLSFHVRKIQVVYTTRLPGKGKNYPLGSSSWVHRSTCGFTATLQHDFTTDEIVPAACRVSFTAQSENIAHLTSLKQVMSKLINRL